MSEKSRESRNPYDLHDFLAELDQALDKTLAEQHSDNPGNPGDPVDPPELGPRVIEAGDWVDDMLTGARAKTAKWKKKAKAPKKDPIKAAVAANDKRKDRLAQAEKDEKWIKKMGKLSFSDYYEMVDATDETLFADQMDKKKAKITKRIGELKPMVETLAKSIDALSDKTDSDREKRMLAARKGMIEIGKKLAGVS